MGSLPKLLDGDSPSIVGLNATSNHINMDNTISGGSQSSLVDRVDNYKVGDQTLFSHEIERSETQNQHIKEFCGEKGSKLTDRFARVYS